MIDRTQLASLDDNALLQSLKGVAARENQITALLLAHLAEVDARGAYRLWSAPTLQAYCTYELRLPEDEAWRRCRAARSARQFPRVLDMLADASLHLTGSLLVGPHLTPDNERELLRRVAFRTKREIERILAEIAPRPDAASLVQPLGPAGDGVPRRAPGTWAAQVRGIAGFERQLAPGVGPGDAPAVPPEECDELASQAGEPDETRHPGASDAPAPPPAPVGEAIDAASRGAPVTSPLRYRVQFTADQGFVDLLSEARDLLWHQLPDGDLASVQRLALEALVAKLRKRKYAATQAQASTPSLRPMRLSDASPSAPAPAPVRGNDAKPAPAPTSTRSPVPTPRNDAKPAPARSRDSSPAAPAHGSAPHPHLPAAVRREVWQRDGARCTFADERGVRCRATAALEFHHDRAHALGGPSTPGNLTLRCRAHNRLAAELDFGAEHVAMRIARARGLGRAVP